MMARRTFGSNLHYNGMPIWSWVGLFVVALAAVGAIEYFELERMAAGAEVPFNLHLSGYANLFLVGAALLYVGHTWSGSLMVGRLASSVAAVGAAGALIALAVRWFETYYLQRPGHASVDGLYETVALFNALTVVIYLVIERVYRNRSAGTFVMAIVCAAVVFQAWLDGEADGGALRSYWIHAHVLGNIVGYAAFAVAASMAIAFLIHDSAPNWRVHFGLEPVASIDLRRLDQLMNQAVILGFGAFSIATALGVMRAWQESSWAWDSKETWALAVWLAYASYFWLRHLRDWHGMRMAWWAIVCFGVALLCLLGAASHSFVGIGAV
jgi:ABC-type transport system involved in cytochrome c biogenesis permease subunit